jgi:hypothetical protein
MRKFHHLLLSCLAGLMLSGVVAAETVALKNDHPAEYTVVKGDTLWDISAMFLRDPWRWPDIWHANQQIANPHLIYPGDVLSLVYIDGQPRLMLNRGTVKLSPQIRSTPIDDAIPVVPIDAIKSFLSRPYVLEKGQLDDAPYIVAFADEHIMGGSGQRFYGRDLDDNATKYDVVRKGGDYTDSETGELLGHEAIYIGSSVVQKQGDPATLLLTDTQQESLPGDRMLPVEEDVALMNFHPKTPSTPVDGAIISVFNGVTQIGQYNVVVIDRGTQNGLEVGDVLHIKRRGETILDDISPERGDTVKLPDEDAGLLMVFRTFDRVSFGIVMHATRAMHVLDKVSSAR